MLLEHWENGVKARAWLMLFGMHASYRCAWELTT